MERAWIVDGPWIARNIKNAPVSSALHIKECGASINCPNCSYRVDNSNVLAPWPGLPKGVKFEPTDEEVIEHLEAKCGIDGLKPHLLIQDFICSVTQDVGINYTHPQNLPGVNKDGTSVFFFNKTAHAYQNGQRKRRRVTPTSLTDESVRWHKTGQTKPVIINGVQKGCKKIMVLYKSARKGLKPEKSNWVLHQYHLGTEEGEIGEFVVSKITYQQQKQTEKTIDESEGNGVRGGPSTPKTTTPTQARPVVSVDEDEITYESFVEGLENIQEPSFGSTSDRRAQVAGNVSVTDDNLVSKKIEALSSLVKKNPNHHGNVDIGSGNFSVSELENAELGTLPDLLSVRTLKHTLKI
ncbi:PREDICTED: NAC domain-containing protein 8-like [Camelina sativa]|uniref:NAC domain-containing protein 8-like n=1 Tax=Camelina sativa TaxID=90675 RepID=A0ABM1REB7_CAMSA|nr:PREDICTED: NAC domain-containing protein 8-like [Camelina sativa]